MSEHPKSAERQALVPAPDAASDLTEWRGPETGDFDLDDFDWVPVHRKRRADGWSIDRQRHFIETLAATGSVTEAAQQTNMSTVSAYRLRNAPDGAPFATAWEIAVQAAARRLTDIAMDRVIHGSDEPVFDRDGRRVGRRIKYDDRLLMFMLGALQPERYRHAHRQDRAPGEALPPPAPAVAKALAMLAPPAPEAPHALMASDELPYALQLAELLDGRLPAAYRDEEPEYEPLPTDAEAAIEAAKEAAAPPDWDPDCDCDTLDYDGDEEEPF